MRLLELSTDKITTTIKRHWLCEIVAKRKLIEYGEIKPYWTKGFAAVRPPFLLRLISGMAKNAPEVTVVVTKIRKNSKLGCYELHLGRIREVKYWDRKQEEPAQHGNRRDWSPARHADVASPKHLLL